MQRTFSEENHGKFNRFQYNLTSVENTSDYYKSFICLIETASDIDFTKKEQSQKLATLVCSDRICHKSI